MPISSCSDPRGGAQRLAGQLIRAQDLLGATGCQYVDGDILANGDSRPRSALADFADPCRNGRVRSGARTVTGAGIDGELPEELVLNARPAAAPRSSTA